MLIIHRKPDIAGSVVMLRGDLWAIMPLLRR